MSSSQHLRAPGCAVHYETQGDGPDVVLVHGLGGSTVIWSDVVRDLRTDHRVVTIDLRGCGQTIEDEPGALDLATWADDVERVLDAERVTEPTLVGHSLGASIVLQLCLTRPGPTGGLVLLNADADVSRLGARLQGSISGIAELGFERWIAERWVQNPPLPRKTVAEHPELLERYRTMLASNRPDDYVRVCRAIGACEDLRPRLAEIDVPAVVVSGELDDRMPPAYSVELAELLPRSQHIDLPGIGHTSPLEAPEAIAAIVRDLERSAERETS